MPLFARRHILPAALIAALLASSCVEGGAPPSEEAELVPQAIRNGTREPQSVALTPGQQLAVGWLHSPGEASRNFCTGVLVGTDLVVTAAHCTAGSAPRELSFGVGLLPDDPMGTFEAVAVHEHPHLDVAVMVLEADVVEALPGLTPIAINRRPLVEAAFGAEVEVAGYGETMEPDRVGRYFAVVELEWATASEVVVHGRGRQGLCFGDSGGPAMWMDPNGEPVVLGVESWGDPSCVGRDHMTRLDTLQDWIDAIDRGETPADPCKGLDFWGQCTEDNVAEWCQNGQLERRDCGDLGTDCGFANPEVGFICTCGDVDYYGRCEGDVAEYCDHNRLVRVDCTERGLSCGLINEEVGYFCTDAPQPRCDPERTTPVCRGAVLRRCEQGRWVEEDCGRAGQVCISAEGSASCQGGGSDNNNAPGDSVTPLSPGIDDADGPEVDVDGEGAPDEAGRQSSRAAGCAALGPRSAHSGWPALVLALLTAGWLGRRR